MTKFVNMRRWSDEKLAKELAFASPNSPDSLERAWALTVDAEWTRRGRKVLVSA